MSFTKATLTTAIQDYTDNSETTFVNNIPNFVKAAEEKIFKSMAKFQNKISFVQKKNQPSIGGYEYKVARF